ncbi:MAG: ABC transporter substrate-binding protein [Nitrosomonadales bacterium]|nr:ABC transporter substrate-binding protein [Nitrosomonadales bacterium]
MGVSATVGKNWVRSCVLLLLVGLSGLLLTACSKEPAQPLRIASSPWPGYEPLYLANEIGYLTADKAVIHELPSSDITLESFRNRSVDIASLTLDETLELLQGGVRLRVLAVMDMSHGADAVMATPKVKSLADLKGKRIAITNIPLGVYMLSRLLDAANLTRADVTVIPSAESRHEEMYRQGKADVFITFEPFKSKLAALGAREIFNSSHIPNEIFDLLLVQEDVYRQQYAEVCDVARQWFRTIEYIERSPQEAAGKMGKRLGVSAAEYRHMAAGIKVPGLQENLRLIGGDEPAILSAAKRLNEVMLREGQLNARVDMRAALDAKLEACIVR